MVSLQSRVRDICLYRVFGEIETTRDKRWDDEKSFAFSLSFSRSLARLSWMREKKERGRPGEQMKRNRKRSSGRTSRIRFKFKSNWVGERERDSNRRDHERELVGRREICICADSRGAFSCEFGKSRNLFIRHFRAKQPRAMPRSLGRRCKFLA